MQRISATIVPLLLLTSLLSGPALAQPDEAIRLFDQARAHVAADQWAEACPLFRSSYQIDPAPGTALNLGECAERDGKPRLAWQMYTTAEQAFLRAGQPDRATFARERAAAVAPKLVQVTLRPATPDLPGLVIQVGDRPLPAAAEVIDRIDREPTTITARAPGHAPFTTTVAGDADAVVYIPALQPIGAPLGAAPAPTPVERRGSSWKAVTLTGVAVTIASVFLASLDGSQAAKYTGSAFLFGGVTTSFVGLALRRSSSSSARPSPARPATATLAPVIGPDRVTATVQLHW